MHVQEIKYFLKYLIQIIMKGVGVKKRPLLYYKNKKYYIFRKQEFKRINAVNKKTYIPY